MLKEVKLKTFLDLLNSSTHEELIWMNGYLSGVISHSIVKTESIPSKNGVSKITIVYGTETGNSKKLATSFAAKAKKNGISAKVVSMDQYKVNDLPKEDYFFSIVSTHGDGEPPAAAKRFYDHIHNNGFELNKLKYGVLALGDTSYPLFCKTGEDVDVQLQKLGASRIVPLQKCDVDYEEDANAWFTQALEALYTNGNTNEAATAAPPITTKISGRTGGKKMYTGTVLTNLNLNDRGSNKETYHIEIAAEEVGYLPGDSIGVIPENPLHIVETIAAIAGIQKDQTTEHKNMVANIYELLQKN